MTMKQLILFDIDDTIFNTILFRKIQDETLAKYLEITDLEIKKIRSEYYYQLERGSDFSIDEFLKIIAEKYQHDFLEIKKVFLNKKNVELCLYTEIPEVLAKLKKQNYSLGVFSEGHKSFQLHKLKAKNIISFFSQSHLYILRRKIDPAILKNLPKDTIIIDDKPDILEELKKFDNIRPIQIIRENKKHEPIVCDNIINSTEQLLRLLQLD